MNIKNDDPRELENEVRLLHDRLNAITMWAINAAQPAAGKWGKNRNLWRCKQGERPSCG